MADILGRQTNSLGPYAFQRKDVFVLNDVDLIVPPTNITIQKQDLIHPWRGIRTDKTTKIPSGHGQAAMSVEIPFIGSQVFDLHRLIVEFTHSPFCYIDNRFVRESIVPHWPISQNMAFTLTSLNVTPVAGSSDTWVAQFDFTWFNYFPYVHNWLYRKDWHTVPLRGENALEVNSTIEVTIGWDMVDGVMKPRHVVLPGASSESDPVRQWDVLQTEYKGRVESLTIDEMQKLHRGEIFDLSPLPGRMQPAQFVAKPSQSLIYTRYINYLQRDALKRNFDIDVEADMGWSNSTSNSLHSAFFGATLFSNTRRTYGLHSGPPQGVPVHGKWRSLLRNWWAEMNSHNGGMTVSFASYNEIRMPREIIDVVSEAHRSGRNAAQTAVRGPSAQFGTGGPEDFWVYNYKFSDMKALTGRINFAKTLVRRGWSNADDQDLSERKYVPVGPIGSSTPYNVEDVPLPNLSVGKTGYASYRGPDVAVRLGDGASNHRMHWGTDFPVADGSPIFAVADGVVNKAASGASANEGRWRMRIWDGSKWDDSRISGNDQDLKSTIKAYVPDASVSANGHISSDVNGDKTFPVGTVVASVNLPNIYYYVSPNGGGNRVAVSHRNGDISVYMHLESVSVSYGQEVKGGDLIGYSGRSGPLKSDFVDQAFEQKVSDGSLTQIIPTSQRYTPNGETTEKTIYRRGAHLHFEYWEPRNHPNAKDPPAPPDSLEEAECQWYKGMVPVDPIRSIQSSAPGQPYIQPRRVPTREDVETVVENELEEGVSADVMDVLGSLWQDGWMYYDRDSNITNVWWKQFNLNIQRRNAERLTEADFVNDPVILTNVSGGFRHVVANIPVIGHEFPTQQHLGSTEPYYSFEFCTIDNLGQGNQALAGLPREAQLLLGMRSMLHSNARHYRQIVDSWACSTDTFITRLLGSYHVDDVRYQRGDAFHTEPFQDNVDGLGSAAHVVEDIDLRRRLLNTNGSSMTMPGQPGLTCHTFEFQETNPYDEEKLYSTSAGQSDTEEAYRDVLQAVYDLKFVDEYKDITTLVLIAQLAGGQTNTPDADNFGQFDLVNVDSHYLQIMDAPARYSNSEGDWVVLNSSNNPEAIDALRAAGVVFTEIEDGVLGIPADVFGPSVPSQSDGFELYSTQEFDAIEGKKTVVRKSTVEAYRYDISELLNSSQSFLQFGQIPVAEILEYHALVRAVVDSAEMLMAETQSDISSGGTIQPGGIPLSRIREDLYGLPVEPKLFRFYQEWLRYIAYNHVVLDVSDPIQLAPRTYDTDSVLDKNPNWVYWNRSLDLEEESRIAFDFTDAAAYVVESGFNISDNGVEVLFVGAKTVANLATSHPLYILATKNPLAIIGQAVSGVRAAESPLVESDGKINPHHTGVAVDSVRNAYENMHLQIARGYLHAIPLSTISTNERLASYFTSNTLLGGLLSTLEGGSGLPVFANTIDSLKETTASCGYWMPAAGPVFVFNPGTPFRDPDTDQDSSSASVQEASVTKPVFLYENKIAHFFFNKQDGLFDHNSPFVWHVDSAVETSKLDFFRRMLARFAADMVKNIPLLTAFGLQKHATLSRKAAIRGGPAYPDLVLPFHPYYGDVTSCSPDFYMWNIYEDGDAHSEAVLESMYGAMNDIVQNCYESMNRVEGGENYEPEKHDLILEPRVADSLVVPQVFQAEGTDGGGVYDRGATAFPYYPHPESSRAIDQFFSDADKQVRTNSEAANEAAGGGRVRVKSTLTSDQIKKLSNLGVDEVRVSLTEGYTGVGGGMQYPRRMTADKYVELKDQVDGLTQMFGSRAGYLEYKEVPEDIQQGLKGTVIERNNIDTHEFTVDSMKKLARESARDIISQKRTMRRAYPTFKLFFVEEDEFEQRLLNFDDFHSYNNVTSFSIVQSRKIAADTAIITLLNVAGTLDGTKRNAVADLDYYGPDGKSPVIPQGSAFGQDPTTQDSIGDQPFGSLVLRPGLNVQLRTGFSNDPENLNVMINGRVVDVQWNTGGDRAEILVQGFGAELQQAIKGSSSTAESVKYATTHQLLGAMMLEPELQHFGRWEFGQLYQVGEGSDSRLDFNDYSREGFMGKFRFGTAAVDWVVSHPGISTVLLVAGGGALSRIPGIGRLFRGVANLTGGTGHFSRFGSKLLSRLGITGSSLGTKAWQKQLVRAASRRAPGQTFTATRGAITYGDIAAVSRGQRGSRRVILKYLHNLGEANSKGGGKALVSQASKVYGDAGRLAAGKTPEQAAKIIAKAEADVLNIGLKNRWMTNPADLAFNYETLVNIGFKPVRNIWSGFITRLPIATAAAGAAGAGFGFISEFSQDSGISSLDRIKAYFRTKKVSILLSPQDDNLFAPHPKDYMEIVDDGAGEYVRQFVSWTLRTTIASVTGQKDIANLAARWLGGAKPFDKRVPVESCEFYMTGQTIWDIFHEMSLRHPGWVYGARPYGTEFRYTMFFGVPSQRYWAQPMDNLFITRANLLSKLLEHADGDPAITLEEYRLLYGDHYDNGNESVPIEEIQEGILSSSIAGATETRITPADYQQSELPPGVEGPLEEPYIITPEGRLYETNLAYAEGDAAERIEKALTNQTLSSKALKEYMSAISIRFQPFRRYHSITSDHDIVFNGLMGSENATYNAVDVTYFGNEIDGEAAGSELFKAHSHLPDHKLRVMPMAPNHNIRGYQMAMRYGMGQLLHNMRDMYRGEVIVLGNPRIRPWDVCVMADSYNDMVGPIEVEQVVHNFSHETGFITEIKPSAFVVANEASSWPVLEAMKMMTMAVKDVEDGYQGLSASDGGTLLSAVDFVLQYGAGANPDYLEHLQRRVDEMRPFDPFGTSEESSDLSELREVDEVYQTFTSVADGAKTAGVLLAAGAAAIGAGAAYKAAPFLVKAAGTSTPGAIKFTRMIATSAVGASIFGGGAALAATTTRKPNLIWLLGGPILFLNCLRGDSVMVVPLMKSGNPIVSGLNLTDPGMIWKNYKGKLGRWVDDHVSGTRDLAELWRVYGMHAWRRNSSLEDLGSSGGTIDEFGIAYAELTGQER